MQNKPAYLPKNVPKNTHLPPQPLEQPPQLNNCNCKNLEATVRNLLKQLKTQLIGAVKNTQKEVKKNVLDVKSIVLEEKGRIGALQKEVRALKDKIEVSNKENRMNNKQNRMTDNIVCPLEQDMIKFQMPTDTFQDVDFIVDEQASKSFNQLTQFIAHPDHKYNKTNFTLKHDTSGHLLTNTLSKTQWNNFIHKQPLKDSTSVTLELVQTQGSQIMLGLGTSDLFDKITTMRRRENVMFDLSTGSLWKEGNKVVTYEKIVQKGNWVLFEYESEEKVMRWFNFTAEREWERMGQTTLPKSMEHKQLFFVVTILRQGDAVRLITY